MDWKLMRAQRGKSPSVRPGRLLADYAWNLINLMQRERDFSSPLSMFMGQERLRAMRFDQGRR